MKSLLFKWIFGLFILLCFSFQANAQIADSTTLSYKQVGDSVKVVYTVNIQEEIGPKVWRETLKSFKDAKEKRADLIILNMNTYGGMVVYADSLRSLILRSSIPVWVLIDNNAASAGALIALACDSIFMVEGGNIGAATVVNQTGEAMPDKYQSYMRSMMRSTAQAKGMKTVQVGESDTLVWRRNPLIAEGMVDPRVYIEGVIDTGKVITFTSHEAVLHGYCDGIVVDEHQLLEERGYGKAEILSFYRTWTDRVIGFLINPIIQGVLILMIVVGIYMELQAPGIGFALGVAILGAVLYFAPLYLEGIANYWEVLLFIVGVILLLLEIFVIPGFGVAGISGICCIIVALVFAKVQVFSWRYIEDVMENLLDAIFLVVASLTIGVIGILFLARKLLISPKLPFALHAEQRVDDGYIGVDLTPVQKVGQMGIAYTDLRPSGKVLIGEDTFDAVAVGGKFILRNSKVFIERFQSGQLYVSQIEGKERLSDVE